MSQWKIHDNVNFYFITNTIVEWIPVFVEPKYFLIITDSLNYCIENKGLFLHAYVIMPNHMHMIASCAYGSSRNISGVMRDFKRFTSRSISRNLKEDFKKIYLKIFEEVAHRDSLGNDFKVWQKGFHPIAIDTDKFCRQKIDYIHINPVRKGYVLEPEHWYYSSARNYAGLKNVPIQVDLLF